MQFLRFLPLLLGVFPLVVRGQLQGAQATFDVEIPSSFETVQNVTAFAMSYATQAVNFVGGNYGNTDLINEVIGLVEAAQATLVSACSEVEGADEDQTALCKQEVTETMEATTTKLTTMRDIDIEQDIIVLFGQYWRPNACLGGQSFGAPPYGNPQCWDVEKNYSIHGIWPSSSNVRVFPNPTNCSAPDDLQPDDVPADLESLLNERWISYYPMWNNFDFWQWEWYKHGSCWDRTKQEFLQQAMDWHDLYDIPAIIQEEGIPLGELVNKTDILERLTAKMWGASLGLLCIGDGVYVDQFFACFDYSGQNPIDCPPSSQCKDEVLFRVYQPEDVPLDAADGDDGDNSTSSSSMARPVLLLIISASIITQMVSPFIGF